MYLMCMRNMHAYAYMMYLHGSEYRESWYMYIYYQ